MVRCEVIIYSQEIVLNTIASLVVLQMDIVIIADGLPDRVNVDIREVLNSFQETIQGGKLSILDLLSDIFKSCVKIFQRFIS